MRIDRQASLALFMVLAFWILLASQTRGQPSRPTDSDGVAKAVAVGKCLDFSGGHAAAVPEPAAAWASELGGAALTRQSPRHTGAEARLGVRALADDATVLSVAKTWDTTNLLWLINLSWNGGAAPYVVSSSQEAGFQKAVTTLAKGVDAGSLTEPMNMPMDNPSSTKFYSVSSSGTISAAVQGIGYDPEPAPTMPTVSNTLTWWGQTVTYTSDYLDPIAKANLTMMNDLPVRASNATASGEYATSATFTIPDDARSFWPEVVAHGRPSPFNYDSAILLPC